MQDLEAEAKIQVPQTVEQMTSEQLAMLLNQQYGQIMQAQQNLIAINKELEKRMTKEQ